MIYKESIIQHCTILAESYYRLTGEELVNKNIQGKDLAEVLYKAPFVVVSHGTEVDPIFNFANQKAQELWEMDWEEFTQTPSRLSAESISQTARQELLAKAQEKGYVTGYNGIRISKSGKKFHILNTTLWNLSDEAGNYKGQAAMFREWRFV